MKLAAILAVLAAAAGAQTPNVTEIMERNVPKVDPSKTLQEVSDLMTQQGMRIAAVYNGANYLGLVSAEDCGSLGSLPC